MGAAAGDGSGPRGAAEGDVLWTPGPEELSSSGVARFARWLGEHRGIEIDPGDYQALWRWSVDDLDGFWSAVWDHHGLVGRGDPRPALADRSMPGARWFPGLRLNWAENVLHRLGAGPVVVAQREDERQELDGAWLRSEVARVQRGLREAGVRSGDRVAALLPNCPEAVVLLLATAGLGAVFTACPPEFGAQAVLSRWSQVAPTVLCVVDGYRHRGRTFDRRGLVEEVRRALPSVETVVLVPQLDGSSGIPGTVAWSDLGSGPADGEGSVVLEPLPFDHPLYILYSSGTTGAPKPIVHGHGGMLLEHTKLHHLQHDLRPTDRFFWYTTTGWVMWNYSVSALLTGAAVVLFDGDPAHPDLDVLWRLAQDVGVTVFGGSAPYFTACRKAGLRPRRRFDLTRLRQLGSTGAPLPAETASWLAAEVSPTAQLVSASGGTDVASAFLASAPTVPFVAGRLSCRCLGVKVESYDEEGRARIGEEGELVVTEPMPSMPVGFWGDDDGRRYRQAYFERFPGVWTHGDWITVHDDGTAVISGRSDATLNRGGVRLGSSDFYAVLDGIPEVADSVVIHLEDAGGGLGDLLLFVQPAPGRRLDEELRGRIAAALRTQMSPRHVPDEIHEVPDLPRTASGKKIEVPLKRILGGAPADDVLSRGALANPGAVDLFVRLAEDRSRSGPADPSA